MYIDSKIIIASIIQYRITTEKLIVACIEIPLLIFHPYSVREGGNRDSIIAVKYATTAPPPPLSPL